MHDSASGTMGKYIGSKCTPSKLTEIQQSKRSLRQFKQELKDGVREHQNREARAYKADKQKKGQAITKESFEEFKALVAPKVSLTVNDCH